MKTVCALVGCAGLAATAPAGNVVASGSVTLYGNAFPVTTWNINDDSNASLTPRIFGAEGMTLHNGVLYVSHDHNTNRGDGNLVRYTPGLTGDLSAPGTVAMGLGPSGAKWGPEGITVNTSNTGFGAVSPAGGVQLTGVETQGTDAFGVFNVSAPGSAPSPTTNAVPALDDLAWVGSRAQFAAVEDGTGSASFLRFYDHTSTTMTVAAFSAPIADGSKGITTVSAAFATALTGLPVTTSQALIVVTETDGFAAYDTNGTLIGSLVLLDAYAPIVEMESIAIDEVNGLIYLGDEAGTAIHVVTIPAPASLALVAGAALLAGRRRR